MSKPITCSNCGATGVTQYCLCGHCPECVKIMHPPHGYEYTDEGASKLREIMKADGSISLKDAIDCLNMPGDGHLSSCSTHNMPAYPNGPCDCKT